MSERGAREAEAGLAGLRRAGERGSVPARYRAEAMGPTPLSEAGSETVVSIPRAEASL